MYLTAPCCSGKARALDDGDLVDLCLSFAAEGMTADQIVARLSPYVPTGTLRVAADQAAAEQGAP